MAEETQVPEEGQAKYGVACECTAGNPPKSVDLYKVASNEAVDCPDCGAAWKGLGPRKTSGL